MNVVVDSKSTRPIPERELTPSEVLRMVEAGIIRGDEEVELIDGRACPSRTSRSSAGAYAIYYRRHPRSRHVGYSLSGWWSGCEVANAGSSPHAASMRSKVGYPVSLTSTPYRRALKSCGIR